MKIAGEIYVKNKPCIVEIWSHARSWKVFVS